MKMIHLMIILMIFPLHVFALEEAGTQEAYTAAVGADGVQRAEITGGEYFFRPSHIIVKKDVPVEVSVKKESGIVPHNLVISAPEAGMDIKESMSSETKAVRFTPTKAGKYPFYCDKKLPFAKSHREKGMEGILEVTE
ncbi:MAG: cupredoxin domain-containing protein [Nitrospirae bacterium]|nr:cupredoxin domain-containing protein [Nitrospirota bacterium]